MARAKLEFNVRLLKAVSQGINEGRPIWALLVANEYLSPGEPLHRAIAATARPILSRRGYYGIPEEVNALLSGRVLAQFSKNAQERLLGIKEETTATTPRKTDAALLRPSRRTQLVNRRAGALQRKRRCGLVNTGNGHSYSAK